MNLKEFRLDELEPGKYDLRFIAAELLDGTQLILRTGIVKGAADGPVICIIAAQHGNEWNGTYICHQIYNDFDFKKTKGSIILMPTANPIAFHQAQRVSMTDNIDMNRVWGLSHRRKPTEHLAQGIYESFIKKSNYVLDLHSGGPGEYLPCVAVLQHKWANLAASLDLACTMVHEADGKISSAKGSTSLAHACDKLDIPCLLIELGHGRSIDKSISKKLVSRLNNFFIKTGLLDGKLKTARPAIYTGKLAITSELSGFLEVACNLEDRIVKEQVIADITPLFSEKKINATSPAGGIVIYKRRLGLVSQGDTIIHVAF